MASRVACCIAPKNRSLLAPTQAIDEAKLIRATVQSEDPVATATGGR